MAQTELSPPELEAAFADFSRKSGQLETCYLGLRERVEELSEKLSQARTDRHRELLEKERLGNRLSHLLETLPGAFLVIDGDGVILERNKRASDLLNRPLLGVCWSEVVQREFCPNRRVDGDLCLKDGRWINLFRKSLECEHGEILLLTDVTESRRMSEMLQISDRLSAIGEMTASLAHQIRTPLASALLYISQLEAREESSKPGPDIARKAGDCLRNLDRLVNDMLNYAGGVTPHGDTFHVRELLKDVLNVIEPQLDDSSYVTVELQNRDMTLTGNREALLGALVNLVENALQACGEQPLIELSAIRSDDGIYLTVADNGHGIPESEWTNLFQPFYTTRPQGTGLGLAVVRSVAEAHGGSIELESGEHGSTFVIHLPADPVAEAIPGGYSMHFGHSVQTAQLEAAHA